MSDNNNPNKEKDFKINTKKFGKSNKKSYIYKVNE